MKIEQTTISLVPRTTVRCLDLAIMFFGRHVQTMLGLWLLVAVPSGALVFFVNRLGEIEPWLVPVILFFSSSPLGVLLGLAAVPNAFGAPFTLEALLGRLRRHGLPLLLKGLALRMAVALGLLMCVFPGVWLALRTGFFVEAACLSRLGRTLHDHRTDRLLKEEAMDLFLRCCGIVAFCTMLWVVLFVTLDVGSNLLFGFPILFGRLMEADGRFLSEQYLADLLFRDPRVLTAMMATALMVYPIGRLAWFFCYLDVRVRRDCWDMELKLAHEAKRLEQGKVWKRAE